MLRRLPNLRSLGLGARSAGGFSLDFTSGSLPSGVTFTRASSATYFDSNGVMQTATTNAPRFNYDPATLAPRGLLIEPAATNLVTQSEFANGVTDAISRAGLLTGTTFSGLTGSTGLAFGHDGATETYAYKSITVSASTAYTLSVFIRMDDGLAPAFGHATASNVANDFAIVVGTAPVAPNTYTVTNLGGGLYRVTATTTTSGSPGTNQGIVKYATNSNRTFKVSGYQLETGSVRTSYIPTTTATATRAADVALISGTNFSSFYNPAEGTFVWEGDSYKTSGNNAFNVSDGTSNNRITMNNATSGATAVVVNGGASQVAINSAGGAANTVQKRVFAYKANDFAFSQGGGAVQTDTSGAVPTVDRILLGGFTSGDLGGHIRRFNYYPTRLSDAQLVALSTL
jgi:hypothetical protein